MPELVIASNEVPMRRIALVALVALAATLAASCSPSSPGRGDYVQPAEHPAETSVAGSVWVANEGGNSLSVLDAKTGSVRTTVSGVPAPHNVQASADGTTVWTVTGSDLVVAVGADRVELEAVAPTDSHPAHVVAAPDGQVLVTSSGQPSVYTYDSMLRPLQRTPLTGAPHGLRLSADGRTAVVANTDAGTVDVLDRVSGAVRSRVSAGPGPVQTAVSPDGRWAYASVSGARQVVRIDLAKGSVTTRQSLPAAPAQVFLTGSGTLLVANQGTPEMPGSTLSLLDAETLSVEAEIEVGAGPHGVVSDPAGRFAWVSNLYDGTVSVVDLGARRVTGTVMVGKSPNGITFSPKTIQAGVAKHVGLELPQREDRGGHDHGH